MAETRRQTLRVLRAQAGDREALDGLMRSVQEPLYRYVAGLVGDRQGAEDVLQEVFLLICRKLRWLREPTLFRPWAYRIASRQALRHLEKERRRSRQRLEDVDLSTVAAAPDELYDRELVASLPAMLAAVSPHSRTVLSLHYLHDMTLREVADVLGIAEGTVKSRLAHGLETLRRRLRAQGLHPEDPPRRPAVGTSA